ncbi:GGDEF domain-containing protein [Clostridium sp. DL1XJH146]
MNNNDELKKEIFKIIIMSSVIISSICIIGNIISGFPYVLNVKWVIVNILSIATLIDFKRNKEFNYFFQFCYFVFIICIIIPIGWLESGATSNAVAYIFLIMICATFLFENRQRFTLLILLIFVFIIVLSLKSYYPEMFNTYSEKVHFIDTLIQIPLTLIGGYLLLKQFDSIYLKEKEIINNYSSKLQEANTKLEFMAKNDELSKLPNRRVFDDRLIQIFNGREHIKNDIYVVLFDIDHFKRTNDTYGHVYGDEIIKKVARATEGIISIGDNIISRWGGDEFAIILFGNLEEVELCLKELYIAIKGITLQNNENITISCGITKIKINDNVKDVFKRVDEALYKAKEQGKNRYTIV